ncbi:unnamed protein product [Paramecium pentaurelia]|uniref:Uncharacterized protein n=1 Tax=Paramecium pentaurelia TaxID=43138 RepID=A0A8S1SG78_9CILI|nr:unnamed protein product [Paramecium pentaurelia]
MNYKEQTGLQLYCDSTISHNRHHSNVDFKQNNSNFNSFISLQSPTNRKTSECNGLEKKILSSRSQIHRMMENFSRNYDLIQQSDPLEHVIEFTPQLSPVGSIAEIKKQVDIKHDGSLTLQELKSNQTSIIQITRFRFNYFYVRIYDRESPLQAYVRSENSKLSTFKMYISTVAQFPTSFNCEQAIQSKYFKFADQQQRDTFHVKNLYISMYSEEDCLIAINFIFGHYFKKKIKIIREEFDSDKYKQKLYSLNTPRLDSIQIDKITSNLNTKQYQKDQIEQKIKISQRLLKQRILQVVERKKIIQEDKKMDMISKLKANESLKEIRNIQKQIEIQQKLKIRNQIIWIELIKIAQYAAQMKEMLDKMKLHNKYLAKGRLIAWQYKTITMIKIKGMGATVEERSKFKMCLSIKIFTQQLRQFSKVRAIKLVLQFLHTTHLYIQCLQKHHYFVEKVNYVKRVFKNLKQKHKAYRDRLWRLLNKNGQAIILELINKHSQIKKRQYHIDNILLLQIMDDYIQEKKQKCQQYVQNYIKEKNKKKKVLDFTLSMMQPEMFNAPIYEDLVEIYKKYAIQKNIVIHESHN